MVKWIFFDVGSTLVDETEAYDHRVREMISGTSITFKEFDDVRIALAQQGLDGNSAAIKHFGLTKSPWHSEDEVPYSDAHSTLAALIDKGYKLSIIANQNSEQKNAWSLGACDNSLMWLPHPQRLDIPSPIRKSLKKLLSLQDVPKRKALWSVIGSITILSLPKRLE